MHPHMGAQVLFGTEVAGAEVACDADVSQVNEPEGKHEVSAGCSASVGSDLIGGKCKVDMGVAENQPLGSEATCESDADVSIGLGASADIGAEFTIPWIAWP